MMERVSVEFDADIDAAGYDRMRSAIEVRLADGSQFTVEADTYPGGPERPATREQLRGKFRECAGLALPEERIPEVLERLERVDEAPSVSDLAGVLCGSPAGVSP